MQAPGLLFGLASALTTVPALFGPMLGHTFARRHGGFRPLVVLSGLNIALLVWLVAGAKQNSLPTLLVLDLATSTFGAFAGPIFQAAIRGKIRDEQAILNTIRIETIILSSNAIVGLGFGSIFLEALGSRTYLLSTLSGYTLSFFVLLFTRRRDSELFSYGGGGALSIKAVVAELRQFPAKRRVALVMPAAALVGVPLMTMLPALTLRLGSSAGPIFASIPLSLPTFMLFGLSLGQILGPMIATRSIVDSLSSSRFAPHISLIIFISFYAIGLGSGRLEVAFPSIVAAHISTNVLWTYAFVLMQATFSEREIGAVFALQSELITTIYLAGSLLSGAILDIFGPVGVYAMSSIALLTLTGAATIRRR